MIYYAVIDTNVLVSALLSSHNDSATVQVIDRLFSGDIIPLFSKNILDEYNEVLRRKNFHFSEEIVFSLINSIERCGEFIHPTPSGELLIVPKDLPFYEVVLEKREDNAYLITGNIKHFPNKPFIVTPKEFLDILNQR
ncbi:Uncharacterized protein P261_01872 [Lachnospiraceae bacterium TWA4]|nr:Uncharacterized protein P261_01872 [Lachnospiraceae bacterium TWA4]